MADPPSTSWAHWRKAQRLIKSLYLQEKYRPCIQVCRDVLRATAHDEETHPLQDACVNFFLGLCYNEIAQIMHHNSIAKLPAYDDAEKHYLEALTALPTAKDARALCTRRVEQEPEDPFVQPEHTHEIPTSPRRTEDGCGEGRSSRASSLMLSSPPRHPDAEPIPYTSPMVSPTHTTSDVEDLESHLSFSELMTPHRVQRQQCERHYSTPVQRSLPRQLSHMSLAESLSQVNALPRETSKTSLFDASSTHRQSEPSAGLMEPLRMGSRAPHFETSPSMPSSARFQRPKLPMLAIRGQPNMRMSAPPLGNYNHGRQSPDLVSPVSPVSRNSAGSRRSSVSPVSPLGSDGLNEKHSDTSTLSAIIPHTPPHMEKHYSTPALGFSTARAPPKEYLDEAMLARITDHLTAVRAQLEKHMNTVRQAKEQIHRAQALQQLSRPRSIRGEHAFGPSLSTLSTSSSSGGVPTRQKSLTKSRSFWSFAPEDQKARKKQERIEAGRARQWKRQSFDPSRYRDLCEKALAEL